jgi:hypothetical protein
VTTSYNEVCQSHNNNTCRVRSDFSKPMMAPIAPVIGDATINILMLEARNCLVLLEDAS